MDRKRKVKIVSNNTHIMPYTREKVVALRHSSSSLPLPWSLERKAGIGPSV